MNRKNLLSKGLTGMGLAALLAASPAVAIEGQTPPGEPERPERHDWRQLDERLRAIEAKKEAALPKLLKKVSIDGLVEVEAFHRKGYFTDDDDNVFLDKKESDIVLATAALDFHAELNDWTRAHILFLWEEDATEPVDVDEAVISLGNPEKFPFYLNAGKLYVPFGVYATYMISDPLTLELGETNESTVQVGFEHAGLYGSAYGFNGDVNEAGSDDTIDGFGASAGYVTEGDAWGLNVGVDYISNLADSDLVSETLPTAADGSININDQVAGMGAHLHLSSGPFTFYTEYITALDEFAAGELAFSDQGAEPSAWHLEAAYTREVMGKVATFALSYQATDEALALGLPEERYLAGLNVALTENLFWSLEYARDEDYGLNEGGTGGDADTITTQLALEF